MKRSSNITQAKNLHRKVLITGLSKKFRTDIIYQGKYPSLQTHCDTTIGEVDIFNYNFFQVYNSLGSISSIHKRRIRPNLEFDEYNISNRSCLVLKNGVSADAIKDIQIYKGSIPSACQYGEKYKVS